MTGKLLLASCVTALILSSNALAANLADSRTEIIKRYISDLQKADYKDIASLFHKDGVVISTSKGEMNAKEFFYSFLPNVVKAHTELEQIFSDDATTEVAHKAARFHFNFTMKDGETGDGEYMDEFVFAPFTNKLYAVYMFENLKFSVN